MSPVGVRRWRAERMLRRDFEALSSSVLAAVRRRMRASGAGVSQIDLEACYALAWQGLYAAILEGQEIANPAGWLVVVTHRRAVDELRALTRARRAGVPRPSEDPDLAGELDERARLRQLLEGLKARLSPREREAAALCYLQGLTRAEAAAQMGLSERAFRKLMEGRGPGRPGVATKMGTLVETVDEGRWCEQQGSLMRAFAYGILDRRGERYARAREHSGDCPACRAYVASLRGLAAILPPALLPSVLRAGARAHLFAGGGAVGAHAGAAGAGSTGTAGAGGTGVAVGAGAAPGTVGAGAAAVGTGGGGWLLAGGSISAKLAAGCLLALGVGAGCIGIAAGSHAHARRPRPRLAAQLAKARPAAASVSLAPAQGAAAGAPEGGSVAASSAAAASYSTPQARAEREFGLERAQGSPTAAESGGRSHDRAQAASAHSQSVAAGETAGGSQESGRAEEAAPPVAASQAGSSASPAAEAQAQREFAPG